MQLRLSLAVAVLAGAGMLAGSTDAESGAYDAGSALVPRIVVRALPAVVCITTRQIEVGRVLTNHHVGSYLSTCCPGTRSIPRSSPC